MRFIALKCYSSYGPTYSSFSTAFITSSIRKNYFFTGHGPKFFCINSVLLSNYYYYYCCLVEL